MILTLSVNRGFATPAEISGRIELRAGRSDLTGKSPVGGTSHHEVARNLTKPRDEAHFVTIRRVALSVTIRHDSRELDGTAPHADINEEKIR